MRRAIGWIILAVVLLGATSGIARRDALDAEITAQHVKEAAERHALPPEVLFPNAAPQPSTAADPAAPSQEGVGPGDAAALRLPVAFDFMSFQVVRGEVEARFYCSSRCRHELDKRGRR